MLGSKPKFYTKRSKCTWAVSIQRRKGQNMSDEKKSGLSKLVVDGLSYAIPAMPALLLTVKGELGTWLGSRTEDSLAIGSIVLMTCLAALVVYFFRTRPWLRWDEPTGTWISRLNGLRYCEACKNKSGKLSPLKNEVTGWRCMSCRVFHIDPARTNLGSTEPSTLLKRVRGPRI